MNICISNLNTSVSHQDLKELFGPFGEVKSAEVMIDGFTGHSRGFGYVEIENEESAKAAIEKLNKTEFKELTISVQAAPAKQIHRGSYKVGNGAIEAFRFRKN